MTTTTDAFGRVASGIRPLADCPDWCTDPGHIAEHHTDDQVCRSEDSYIDPTLSEESMICATARRDFNEKPVVQIHALGFR